MSALVFIIRFGGRPRTPRGRSARAFLAACICFWATLFSTAVQGAETSKEYQVKAVFLFRLAQFVEWPTNAFQDARNPIIIGVLGNDPFGEALDIATRGETAGGRPLVVQRFRRVDEIQSCHILFISRSEAGKVKDIVATFASKPVLTVSDVDGFAPTHDGMIYFMTEQNKVRLRIDPHTAKNAGLVLNSRLLRMAEVVAKN
jgi:hypothetical protein